MYQFKYALTRDDYLDFNIYFYNNTKSTRRTLNFSRVLILLIAIILPFIMNRPVEIAVLIGTSVTGIIFFALYPRLIDNRLKKRIDKLLDENSNGDMFEEKLVNIDESGIESVSKYTSGKYQWSGVTKVGRNKEYVFIFVNSVQAIILPVSIIEKSTTPGDIIDYCESRMTGKHSELTN